MSARAAMHVTLVKKIDRNGEPCRKCREVLERLQRDGSLAAIDTVVSADERDPRGEGWRLAAEHGVATAPFFVVREHGGTRVYTSYLRFRREVLGVRLDRGEELTELARSPELDFV